MRTYAILLVFFLVSWISGDNNSLRDREAKPILFNNPDLVTDLGVGLWAWPLPMDYDGDGDNDLVVSCPDVPYNGIYFFENITGHLQKPPLFAPPVRIADGERHLQVCFVDGEPRVLGRGVEYQNFRKAGLSEPLSLFPSDSLEKPFTRVRFSQWKYVDYENDGDYDIIVGIDHWGDYGWDNAFDSLGNWVNGPLHGYIFLLENTGERFENRGMITAGGKPIDLYGAPTPCMDDFDGDGDLDIICGEFIDRLTWFENIGTRENPQFAEGRFLSNEEGVIKMDLQMIIPASIDWDGDGDIDLIVGDEDGRVALIENRGVVKDGMPLFSSPVYFRQQAGLLKFGALSTPFSVDWDDDGDEDLICGNTAGQIAFIENLDGGNPPKWADPVLLGAGGEPVRIMAGMNGSIQGPAESKWGYTVLTVADWDHDGLNDIIVNSIWGKVLWFRNNGVKGSPSLEAARHVKVAWDHDPPKPGWIWWKPDVYELVTQWRTTPYATDWNGDGLTDLIMLDDEGYLSFFERFIKDGELMLRPGRRIFYGTNGSSFDQRNVAADTVSGPLRLNYREAGASGRRKFCFADWDGDGDLDLLVNSENIAWFENTGSDDSKVFFTFRGNLSGTKLAGHTTSPTIVDWDHDGVPDLLVGAEDGHFYLIRNSSK
jgi:hypothetical protein